MAHGRISETWGVLYFEAVCVALGVLSERDFEFGDMKPDRAKVLLGRLLDYSVPTKSRDGVRVSLYLSNMLDVVSFAGYLDGSGCLDKILSGLGNTMYYDLIESKYDAFLFERKLQYLREQQAAEQEFERSRTEYISRRNQLKREIRDYKKRCEDLGIRPIKRYLSRKGYTDNEIYAAWRTVDREDSLQVS